MIIERSLPDLGSRLMQNHWPDFVLGASFGATLVMAFVKQPKWQRKIGGKQYCFYMGIVTLVLGAVAALLFFSSGSEFLLVMGFGNLVMGVRYMHLYLQAPEPGVTTLNITSKQ